MKYKFLLVLILFLTNFIVKSQEDINQFDAQGKRHGIWKKTFEDSDQIRYEGAFNHGKEIGIFKFYCSDCKKNPAIIKTFNEKDDTAQVVYLTIKGKLISEGKMKGKNRIDEWLYYHKRANSIMTKEFYTDGKLDGLKTTYYLNKIIAEELAYKNGIKEGINNYYSPDGVLLKKLIYKNDELHGPAFYYDALGNVTLKGNYKNGRKHGVWKYYKDGKFIKEETFPRPLSHH